MNLLQAQRWAAAIVARLEPFCHRIEVAGSIRRLRPECADIDIVCQPKVHSAKDLLGAETERSNQVIEWARAYVAEQSHGIPRPGESTPRIISGGDREGKQLIVQLRLCQLDLWFADETNWATRLLCRTGSREHNMWLCDRAIDLGGHWNPYAGLEINGVQIPAPTEECIYAALGLAYIEPQNRELPWLKRMIDSGL